jgi:hypothetical protein
MSEDPISAIRAEIMRGTGGPAPRKLSPEEYNQWAKETNERALANSPFYEAPKREAAPQPKPVFEPRTPTLPDNLESEFATLLEAIREVGVPLDKAALVANGKRLLGRSKSFGRSARLYLGSVPDLSDWKAVRQSLGTWHLVTGNDRIEGFVDCWAISQPEAAQIYQHWLCNQSLKHGSSLVNKLTEQGRVHSDLFTTSLHPDIEFDDLRTRLFWNDWRAAVRSANGKEFVSIDIRRAIPATVGWMAGDVNLAAFLKSPDPWGELAQEWEHLPRIESVTRTQRAQTAIVATCVMFGPEKPALRNLIGNSSGFNISIERLGARRGDLFTRFPQTRQFLETIKGEPGHGGFWTPLGNQGQYEFNETGYLDRVRESILHRRFLLNAIATRAVSDAIGSDGKIAGAVRDTVLIETSSKAAVRLAEQCASSVRKAVAAAFPGFGLVLSVCVGPSWGNMRSVEGVPTGEKIIPRAEYFRVRHHIGAPGSADGIEPGTVIARSRLSESQIESFLESGAIEATTLTSDETKYPAFE